MRTHRLARVGFLAALVGGIAACAPAGPGPSMEGLDPQQTYVIVDSRNAPMGSATIHLHPERGGQRVLGSVSINQERTFEVDIGPETRFRLVAESGLDEVPSRSFTLTPGDVVEWNISLNTIDLRRSGGA